MTSVVVKGGPDLRQEIVARGKTVVADEPADVGGGDAGPTPYELLLGALGACTAMTIILYAKRKRWEVERVTVELEHDRVHAEDCLACASGSWWMARSTRSSGPGWRRSRASARSGGHSSGQPSSRTSWCSARTNEASGE
jgi:hypothetical protein